MREIEPKDLPDDDMPEKGEIRPLEEQIEASVATGERKYGLLSETKKSDDDSDYHLFGGPT